MSPRKELVFSFRGLGFSFTRGLDFASFGLDFPSSGFGKPSRPARMAQRRGPGGKLFSAPSSGEGSASRKVPSRRLMV
jgi:hypothetical protein